ncbi:relaxase/mobilization nuclease domain-containing protein [Vibrio splendidus]|uniref:relaxase/mobilization nuclease domain-containing protein n=1 Tax=Vibrio splendidus TaxID=29497 RepID=UPI000C82F04D|nr:relaxase/mobilization nuclease domain-containing protein [Vibrio splendidus]PMI54249.1 relaxase [Vibrio splendidus]
MIFEELKCKNDKQTVQDAAQLVRYGAKQSDDVTQMVEYSSSQSKDDNPGGTSHFICANEIASVPLNASKQDARKIDWSQAIVELQSAHLTNPNTKQPYRHFVVSLAEGEQLAHQQWKNTIKKLMTHLGYENARYIAYMHSDTDNEHVHIVVSTTDLLTGKIISNWQSHLRAQEVMREQEEILGLQKVASSGELHTTYDLDTKGEKEKTVVRIMRRKVDSAVRSLPRSCSLSQFEIALLNQGIEIELIPDKTESHFKGVAYRYHKYRFAASSLRSGNKYTLGKLIKNGILNSDAVFIDNYNKHHQEIKQATAHFEVIREQAINHADQLKVRLEEYEHQQYRFMIFRFAKAHEEAMMIQAEYWFEYAKRIQSTRDRAIVKALYEFERGVYTAAKSVNLLFYHLILALFEYSLHKNYRLSIEPVEKQALAQHEENNHNDAVYEC